jgi:hypothetical protein
LREKGITEYGEPEYLQAVRLAIRALQNTPRSSS